MAVQEFSLDTLPLADGGRIEALFRRHLNRAVDDCRDRPGDKSPRQVVIKFNLTPNIPMEGVVDADLEIQVSSKVPTHISRTINCQIRNGNRLAFNDLNEGDVDQRTLDMQE